ncbi:hypothetical protein L9W92_13820 [Pelotomaculum terephthalicicum JT]|uniref:hypothetical protein n=1 Tax=Pelotomaculum terephthalicicum TaxID=206393 RepID=UPI001F03A6E2|nr:hypothetical protein [Pelotomaculum terephthalicicum]MCG9969111.1 hypothetical protein [Pelotomaculum terephthalicicum JT]
MAASQSPASIKTVCLQVGRTGGETSGLVYFIALQELSSLPANVASKGVIKGMKNAMRFYCDRVNKNVKIEFDFNEKKEGFY